MDEGEDHKSVQQTRILKIKEDKVGKKGFELQLHSFSIIQHHSKNYLAHIFHIHSKFLTVLNF